MKKFLSSILALALVLSLLVVGAMAVSAEETTAVAMVGEQTYMTLADAVAVGGEVTLLENIELSETIKVEGNVILNLNNKHIAGTDNATGSFALIEVQPGAALTVKGVGKISLKATNDRGTNSYSSVISNQRGKVTIEGGTIQHTGGTYMAYAIDNLTNGKGTYAETVINGGLVSSTYRAVRQFLNGVEAQNILTINGGELRGGNKSIWMQNANANKNPGALTVGENAALVGDVLISGSSAAEVDMTVSVSANALTLGSTVTGSKLPDGIVVENNNGSYGIALGLAGSGTEADPYQIGSVEDLILFRDSVNAGETKYSAPGVYVALTANIDMEGINWVGIGSATAEHGFLGNFDGNGFKIQNLTITNPTLDSDGYAYAGLFAVTEGAAGAENVIKNLVIENVTISTNGHIVAAAIAYPYYTTVDNVTVCGDISIAGGDYTSGVLAYTRRCVNASNLSLSGNAGSTITGRNTVGGVISDIQMNGGLTANYSNFAVSGVEISGVKSVGGISGIISGQTLNGATVKNVSVNCENASKGIVAGSMGMVSTVSNVAYEKVTGATAVIGSNYDNGQPLLAKVGDKYYTTFAEAVAAANTNDTIVLLSDVALTAEVRVEKSVTIDLGGNTLSSTGVRAIHAYRKGSVVTVQNGTISSNYSGVLSASYNGKLILGENLTVKSTGNYGVYINRGELEVSASTVYVEGATRAIGIKAHNENKLVIMGGVYSHAVSSEFVPADYIGIWNADAKYEIVGTVKVENGNAVKYYTNLAEAAKNAEDGAVITLMNNLTLTADDFVMSGNYRVMADLTAENVTLNLNGKAINVEYDESEMLIAVIRVADGAGLTVTGNGTIDVAKNGENVAYMFWKAGSTGYLTIENGNFHMDNAADSMIYTNGSEIVTVKGGTFTLDAAGTRPNGFPCIFNAHGQNTKRVVVEGGTFNTDIMHQHYPFEVQVDKTLALAYNENDGIYTVVPAMAYVSEINGAYTNEVGYTSFAEAFEAAKDGEKITLLATDYLYLDELKDFDGEYLTYFEVNNETLTVDLNGYKLQGITKGAEKMVLGMFATNDNGHLILEDSSEAQTGTIQISSQGSTLYALLVNYESDCSITVNGGNYTTNKAYDCLIYTSANEGVVINGGTFNLSNVGQGPRGNGSPWIFNALGQNTKHVVINGGSFNADVLHQYWLFEVEAPKELALKYNESTGMYTIVPAVAYVNEQHWSGNWYTQNVGYATVEEANAAVSAELKTKVVNGKTYTAKAEEVILLPSEVSSYNDLYNSFYEGYANHVLVNDITVDNVIYFAECANYIDLNGQNMTATGDWLFGAMYDNCELTVNGQGTVNTGKAFAGYVAEGGKLTVNGGTYQLGATGQKAHFYVQNSGLLVINGGTYISEDANTPIAYCINGHIEINGGFFQNTANAKQALLSMGNNLSYVNNQKITLSGGTFVNWNPMSSSFAQDWPQCPALIVLADGYKMVSETQANGDIWYTVVAE